ncbi:MAG: hypothetical protein NXI23_21555 [Bacteroidetes bacterium]|jgi:uncharacterized tellurite resistance protein B-like protein|nr:hypothetical protein [Bacteroidota bacterium]
MSENYNIDTATKSHFLNLFSIALSDSTMDPIELKMLYNIGLEKGIKKEEVDFIINNPHKVRFYKPLTNLEALEQLYDLIRMVLADGIIDPRELTVCSTIAEKLGFQKENIPDLIDYLIEEKRKNVDKDKLISKIRLTLNK